MNLTETQLAGVLAETQRLANQFTAYQKQLYLVGGRGSEPSAGSGGGVRQTAPHWTTTT